MEGQDDPVAKCRLVVYVRACQHSGSFNFFVYLGYKSPDGTMVDSWVQKYKMKEATYVKSVWCDNSLIWVDWPAHLYKERPTPAPVRGVHEGRRGYINGHTHF